MISEEKIPELKLKMKYDPKDMMKKSLHLVDEKTGWTQKITVSEFCELIREEIKKGDS